MKHEKVVWVENVRSAALSLVREARGMMDQAQLDPQHVVHQTRVNCKKLRAWWYLVREGIPSERSFENAKARLHRTSHILATHRDNDVLLHTLAGLKKQAQMQREIQCIDHVCADLGQRPPTESQNWQDVGTAWARELAAWRRLRAPNNAGSSFPAAITHTYRRARKWGGKATSGSFDPGLYHHWRRWVKRLYYQLDLIPDRTPASLNFMQKLEKLGGRLGLLHDLYVLRVALQERWPERAAILVPLIDRREAKLLRKAQRQYAQMFRGHAGQFRSSLPEAL